MYDSVVRARVHIWGEDQGGSSPVYGSARIPLREKHHGRSDWRGRLEVREGVRVDGCWRGIRGAVKGDGC